MHCVRFCGVDTGKFPFFFLIDREGGESDVKTVLNCIGMYDDGSCLVTLAKSHSS